MSVILLTGCAPSPATSTHQTSASQTQTPPAEYSYGADVKTQPKRYNPQNPAAPGATVIADIPAQTPSLKPGTKVIALTSEKDAEAEREAIHEELLKVQGIDLDWRVVPENADIESTVTNAFQEKSDLIVDVGPSLIGGFDLVTASFLHKRTITFGTQMAEPTDNVDAVIWPGAEERAAVVGEELKFTNSKKWAKKAVAVAIDAFLSKRKCLVYLLQD